MQVDYRAQAFVDSPQLLGGEMANQLTQSTGVDGTGLFDEDSCRLSSDLDLATECRPGAQRCRGDQNNRSREQGICLDHYTETRSVLFVAGR